MINCLHDICRCLLNHSKPPLLLFPYLLSASSDITYCVMIGCCLYPIVSNLANLMGKRIWVYWSQQQNQYTLYPHLDIPNRLLQEFAQSTGSRNIYSSSILYRAGVSCYEYVNVGHVSGGQSSIYSCVQLHLRCTVSNNLTVRNNKCETLHEFGCQ